MAPPATPLSNRFLSPKNVSESAAVPVAVAADTQKPEYKPMMPDPDPEVSAMSVVAALGTAVLAENLITLALTTLTQYPRCAVSPVGTVDPGPGIIATAWLLPVLKP